VQIRSSLRFWHGRRARKSRQRAGFSARHSDTPAPTPANPNFQLPPTQAQLTEYFNGIRNQVRGKRVLIGTTGNRSGQHQSARQTPDR
jgi:hypothetical protein